MGRAAAYDFKILVLTLGIIGIAIVAATAFSGRPTPSGAADEPKLSLGG